MTTHDSEFAIIVSGLTKCFENQTACDSIDLRIQHGQVFGLLGPNGAGKSTFIRILMGLLPADSGSANVLGFDVRDRHPDMRNEVGYVPELHHIYRWMTVRQVIDFAGRLYSRWDSTLADDLLDRFELPQRKYVSTLSKGMTAKLGLLLALAHQPKLLILDEPTSGLDPIIREDFLESVLQCHSCQNRTVLFSSHHVDDVERVADVVGIIHQGRMQIQGSVESLRSRVKRVHAVLKDGRLPEETPADVVHTSLSRRHWTVTTRDYSDDFLSRLEKENDLDGTTVSDLCLEEIFKDVIRGAKVAQKGLSAC